MLTFDKIQHLQRMDVRDDKFVNFEGFSWIDLADALTFYIIQNRHKSGVIKDMRARYEKPQSQDQQEATQRQDTIPSDCH